MKPYMEDTMSTSNHSMSIGPNVQFKEINEASGGVTPPI